MAEDQLLVLDATTLPHLDRGLLAATLEKAIARAVADCADRVSDERVRKVTLELAFEPVKDVRDNVVYIDGVASSWQIRCKIPDWQSAKLDFGVRKSKGGPVVVFSPDSPANHRQSTMFADGE